jgi:hypothetical protein
LGQDIGTAAVTKFFDLVMQKARGYRLGGRKLLAWAETCNHCFLGYRYWLSAIRVRAHCSCVLANSDYSHSVTETLSIKVSKEMKARLRAAAENRRTKAPTLLREALELVIAGLRPKGNRRYPI